MRNINSQKAKRDQPYLPATSKLLFLDREGNENELEPKYLKKLKNYFKNMTMIEATSLPMKRDLYGGIERAIVDSRFWFEDNEDAEYQSIRTFGPASQTDATKKMAASLRSFFQEQRIPVSVIAISIDPDDIGDPTKALQTNSNPNQFVVSAQAGVLPSGRLQLILLAVQSEEDFDSNLVSPQIVADEISTKIRHEFVHSKQYDSLARAKGISRLAAKNQYEEWGLIPLESAPRQEYLGSHIEIDAFGHEFAELLAQKYGLRKADQIVASADQAEIKKLAQDIDTSGNLAEYYVDYSDEKFTRKLQKKIRKYLKLFRANQIYDDKLSEAVVKRLISISDKQIKNKNLKNLQFSSKKKAKDLVRNI